MDKLTFIDNLPGLVLGTLILITVAVIVWQKVTNEPDDKE